MFVAHSSWLANLLVQGSGATSAPQVICKCACNLYWPLSLVWAEWNKSRAIEVFVSQSN